MSQYVLLGLIEVLAICNVIKGGNPKGKKKKNPSRTKIKNQKIRQRKLMIKKNTVKQEKCQVSKAILSPMNRSSSSKFENRANAYFL